jgi:single-strand DNA-binding protein
MASVNKVMLLGNLTRDPEIRYTPKGTAVAEIGMAINRIRKGDNGEKIEEVTYVDVTLWGRQAELASEYLKKGRPVFIEGRLQLDQWDDKETGEKRSKMRVVGENMQFLPHGGGGEQRSQSEPPADRNQAAPPATGNAGAPPPTSGSGSGSDDDIPF